MIRCYMQKKMSTTNNAVLLEMLKKQSNNKRAENIKLYCIMIQKIHLIMLLHCLMDICQHNELQAYQCALIVHTAKQCSVA
jgi:hypothetical protein